MTFTPQVPPLQAGTFGFGPFELPGYRDASRGDWRVRRHLPSLGNGYLTTAALEVRTVLSQGDTVWMSTGLLERESHAWHVHCARGVVVTAGLGLGMYAYAAAMKPEVELVVAADHCADVIALMQEASGVAHWPCRHKLCLLQADALAPDFAAQVVQCTGGRAIDYLYADIWPSFPADEAPAQTARMVRGLRPRSAGWWGQELSFARWCRDCDLPPTLDNLRGHFVDMGVPADPLTPGYLAFCRQVMAAHGMDGPPPLRQRLARWWHSSGWEGGNAGLKQLRQA